MNITGHVKELTKNEWIESYNSYIATAKLYIARARRSSFGRDYYLNLALSNLDLAGHCSKRIENFHITGRS